jgi:Ribonuclease G/E
MRPGGPLVKTARTVAHEALGALRREARARPEVKWRLTVSPDVATALAGGAAPALRSLEERFGRKVAIASDNGLNRERFEIGPV